MMENKKEKRSENAFVGFMFLGMGMGFLAKVFLSESD